MHALRSADMLWAYPTAAPAARPSRGRSEARELAARILDVVMRYRRLSPEAVSCSSGQCLKCRAPHVDRVAAAVLRDEPVVFVLPAFPCKSPNPAKVLGPTPDMAERRSLEFLTQFCSEIRAAYAPGARIVLCSDGRVFNDVIGVRDADVTAYQDGLTAMLQALETPVITTFNLDDAYAGCGFDAMRERMVSAFGQPLDALRSAVQGGGEPLSLYRGITRFLLEDAARPGTTLSRTALQKDCRRRAYQVIQRSKAWGELVAAHFPDGVRLSIHPQTCGSQKLGIHLMNTADSWLTPWHGVAVESGGRWALLKRSEADALGAELVFEAGRPSHYTLGVFAPSADEHGRVDASNMIIEANEAPPRGEIQL